MRSILLATIFAIALLGPVRAEHCVALHVAEIDTRDAIPGRRLYVDTEDCIGLIGIGDCLASVWIYEESNGLDGLQRDDFRMPGCGAHPADTFVALVFARAPTIG